jgi:flavin reductase (DIM6/NTAB) family NADH-FMN oxidoreductase RutF
MFRNYIGRFYYLLHPRLTVIVGSVCPNGRVNLMPASWNTPVSEEPPAVAVAIDSSSYTRECLDYCGEATLSILSLEDSDLIYLLGTTSGRDVDKVAQYGVELVDSVDVRPPGIKRALAILETRVLSKYQVGESILYILQVLRARVREGVADRYGYTLSTVSPALHGVGRYFYGVGPRREAARRGGYRHKTTPPK